MRRGGLSSVRFRVSVGFPSMTLVIGPPMSYAEAQTWARSGRRVAWNVRVWAVVP